MDNGGFGVALSWAACLTMVVPGCRAELVIPTLSAPGVRVWKQSK